ncbi:hypothetical protein R3P38DRAFT_3170891 [Favolaschia claudopus]|uniref:Uncharacterized protein n=1 Tax=Favolaschia claudopus TaxID=2862362 RepID=A0AAW0DQJ8_9AGAR
MRVIPSEPEPKYDSKPSTPEAHARWLGFVNGVIDGIDAEFKRCKKEGSRKRPQKRTKQLLERSTTPHFHSDTEREGGVREEEGGEKDSEWETRLMKRSSTSERQVWRKWLQDIRDEERSTTLNKFLYIPPISSIDLARMSSLANTQYHAPIIEYSYSCRGPASLSLGVDASWRSRAIQITHTVENDIDDEDDEIPPLIPDPDFDIDSICLCMCSQRLPIKTKL